MATEVRHLFSYADYKKYVNDRLDSTTVARGNRSALARSLGCQTAYVSSVLRGHAHFTPEQAEGINQYLAHTETESDFFLLLLQLQRAGTEALRKRLRRQMDQLRAQRFDLEKRLSIAPVLKFTDQATFYSEWYYAAIHALVSISGFQSIAPIATYLRLDPSVVASAVEFLLKTGLLEQGKSGLRIGKSQTHLGADSPFVSKHHMNLRLQALQRLPDRQHDDLHYSSMATLSHKDAVRIKEKVVELIKDAKHIIRDSKEETLQGFTIDFFKI